MKVAWSATRSVMNVYESHIVIMRPEGPLFYLSEHLGRITLKKPIQGIICYKTTNGDVRTTTINTYEITRLDNTHIRVDMSAQIENYISNASAIMAVTLIPYGETVELLYENS